MAIINAIGNIAALGTNYNKGMMTTQLQIKDLLQIYTIDREVNRDLGYHRLPKLVILRPLILL
ncbi:hypothetical protein JNUCC74_11565 [Cerasibacillus sp. JNUCC 74]